MKDPSKRKPQKVVARSRARLNVPMGKKRKSKKKRYIRDIEREKKTSEKLKETLVRRIGKGRKAKRSQFLHKSCMADIRRHPHPTALRCGVWLRGGWTVPRPVRNGEDG